MEQTNRTILFAELNPGKKNLLSFLMEDQKVSCSDADLAAADDSLTAGSLEEALTKLQPELHIGLHTAQSRVRCTRSREELAAEFPEIYTIQVSGSYQLLQLFRSMIDSSLPQKTILFAPQKILEHLFSLPDPVLFEKTRIAAARDFCRGHIGQAALKWKQLFLDCDNSILLIRLFLQMVQEASLDSVQEEAPAIVIEEKEETQMAIKMCSAKFLNTMPYMTAEEQQEYESLIRTQLEASSVHNRELWRQVLCMPYQELLGGQEQILAAYQKYQAYYGGIVTECWNVCCPLLETLLGIQSFFDQYRTSDQKMPPRLICANLSPEAFLDLRNQERLRSYLKSANEKTDLKYTIWYAVLPGMEWEERERNGEARERFKGSGGDKLCRGNSKKSVRILLKLLAEARIQTFLSQRAVDWADSRDFLSREADAWAAQIRQVTDSSYAAYVYPCIQNFTLVRKEDAAVSLGRTLMRGEWGELCMREKHRLARLTDVVIEASYAAAGFFAACQCPGFLNERFPDSVDLEAPGVALNTTNEACAGSLSLTLRMNPVRDSAKYLEALRGYSAGIVFFLRQGRTVLLSDRAASGLYGGEDTLHEIQTMTYIERILRMETQDFKSASVSRFFQKRPGSILRRWSDHPLLINSILKKDETISCHLDERTQRYTLKISFQSGRKARELG